MLKINYLMILKVLLNYCLINYLLQYIRRLTLTPHLTTTHYNITIHSQLFLVITVTGFNNPSEAFGTPASEGELAALGSPPIPSKL